jgi:hypothetical protein
MGSEEPFSREDLEYGFDLVDRFDDTMTEYSTTNEALALKRLRQDVKDLNEVLPKTFLLSDGAQPQDLLDYANHLIDKAREIKMIAIEMKQEQPERLKFRLPSALEKSLDKLTRVQLRSPQSAKNAASYAMRVILKRTDVESTFLVNWESGVHCDCQEEGINYARGKCPCREWDCDGDCGKGETEMYCNCEEDTSCFLTRPSQSLPRCCSVLSCNNIH